MKIVLTKNIKGWGVRGTVFTVADGYARGFLLPHKQAVEVSSVEGKKVLEEKKHLVGKHLTTEKNQNDILKYIPEILEIFVKTSEKDSLYQSVSQQVIASALNGKIDQKDILMDKIIDTIGKHVVTVFGKEIVILVNKEE